MGYRSILLCVICYFAQADPKLEFTHFTFNGSLGSGALVGEVVQIGFQVKNIGDQDFQGGTARINEIFGPATILVESMALSPLKVGESVTLEEGGLSVRVEDGLTPEPNIRLILQWEVSGAVIGNEFALELWRRKAFLKVEKIDFGVESGIKLGESGNIFFTVRNVGDEIIRNAKLVPFAQDCASSIQGNFLISQLKPQEFLRIDTPAIATLLAAPECENGEAVTAGLEGSYESLFQAVALKATSFFPAGQLARSEWPLINLSLKIPDPGSVSQNIDFPFKGKIVDVGVRVDITHEYISDLKVDLVHPDGMTTVRLHNESGGSSNDIHELYGLEGTPITALSQLVGKSAEGTWKLTVVDTSSSDTGTLDGVNLIVVGYFN